MTIDTNLFWNLLKESRVVELSRIQTLNTDFQAKLVTDPEQPPAVEMLAQWLVEEEAISPYQARILLAGHSGPMRFSSYVVTEKIEAGPRQGTFKAIHRDTGYPVNLQFMSGSEQTDLQIWRQLEALAERVSSIIHPNLVPIFETVALPNHRFVVSESSIGSSLSQLVPRKGRLPWKDACSILAQVAIGLQKLHDQGIVHNAISPRSIWVASGGHARLMMGLMPEKNIETSTDSERDGESRYDYLAPETLSDQPQLSSSSDHYALGCTLYRLISGRTLFPTVDLKQKVEQHRFSEPKDLSKYEIPAKLQRLVNQLLSKDPKRRPDSAQKLAELLAEFSGNASLFEQTVKQSDAQLIYRDAIKSWNPLADHPEQVDRHVTVETERSSAQTETSSPTDPIASAHRKKSKWLLPISIAAGLLAVIGIIGLFAYTANQTPIVVQTNKPPVTEPKKIDFQDLEKPDFSAVRIVQDLIEDDGNVIWESPTTGLPIDFSYVPATPKLIFAIKPAALWAEREGKLLFQSLGPELASRIENWKDEVGLEFEDIAQVIVSFHSNGTFEYEPFFVVHLTGPATTENLEITWKNPPAVAIDDNNMIYETSENRAFYIIRAPEGNEVTQFVFGNTQRVREVIDSGGASVLSGAMNNLLDWSDSERHFTFMFLRHSLFNEQGQALMSGQLSSFNRQLDLFLQDEIRGGLLSMHLDEGTYLEMVFDQTVDLQSTDLQKSLQQRLRDQRDELTRFITTIPASPYWDKVRLKYDNMLSDVYRNLRWNVEYRTVIGNCWLPPMAGHNLIAASELLTAFSKGASPDAVAVASRKIPQTIKELLAKKRSLDVSTNPDLNIFLAGIRSEVLDDFGELPFEFNIRLIGNDLEKEGITQNQRPGDFKIIDQSLADILTEIMVRCNPNKDISGPADPNCKMVWVIGPDPSNTEQDAILITTREGAAQKGLTLPAAFLTE